MQYNNPFNFDYSYQSLPDKFYSLVQAEAPAKPELLLVNEGLGRQLNIPIQSQAELLAAFFGEKSDADVKSFAQAYAGHQFGGFTKLGDGRAIILGEHLAEDQRRFDIQLKGSGRTPYSRLGDGKATLKAMLREYLISEAMHALKVPSSRSLAVIKTGEPVYRHTVEEGAMLVRVMKSHIRVGTFEYAAHFGSADDVKGLTDYTIKRLYPEIEGDENPVLSLLNRVMSEQIDLVANWMRVGFIHGVMNTDNTSISGETFDYGPCAFMNAYHPDTVYSSIDQYGRYSFGNQAPIIKWNIARFAETLMRILHEDKDKSLKLAQTAIDGFEAIWKKKYYEVMLKKIGLEESSPKHYGLVEELLNLMSQLKMDYTNTFRDLSQDKPAEGSPINSPEFQPWLEQWKDAIAQSTSMEQARKLMARYNPLVIPRNHLVEQALDEAASGDMESYNELLEVMSNPYQPQDGLEGFTTPPAPSFEKSYQTFCGT